ncbi:hypothetical protein DV736_g747, partial [Chaetothyriales sp. CBS 134916]
MKRHRTPSRMLLADDVDRAAATRRPKKRAGLGPFAAINVTDIPPRLRQQLESQLKSPPPTSEKERAKGKQRKKQDDRPLFHALKMQRTLTPLSYNQRDKIKAKIDGITDFEQLGLLPAVASAVYSQALPGLAEYTPTPIQKLAIPALLGPSDGQQLPKKESEPPYGQFLLAAETGSGKTLAYLLPVIDAVKRQDEIDKAEDAAVQEREADERVRKLTEDVFHADPSEDDDGRLNAKAGKPRALILLPSSELVVQVGKVVKAISHTVKFRSAPISAANSPTVIRNRVFNAAGIDILVSTPHLISSIATKDPNVLSRLQYLVCDEADSLLDKSFSDTVTSLIDRAAPSLRQLILCSATIPRSLDRFLDHRYPQIKRVVTPKLHSITRRVQLGVIDIEREPYRGSRQLACADVVWQIGKAEHDDTHSHHAVKCIMVFVNEREEAEALAKFLVSKGIEAVPLTRDTSEQRSGEVLAAFTSHARVEGAPKEAKEAKKSFSNLGSRGIDTLAVRHVILYDVPHTTIDFVHRLGRVGRMGRRGRGIVLVGRRDRKDVVREVRDAMFQGKALI